MNNIRYDRQIRLWGDHGQSSIEATTVCVLGTSALGTEMLKNLVLAGVQSVSLIDDALISVEDLGNNFFITDHEVGMKRAEVTARYLSELNPAVTCEHVDLSVSELVTNHLDRLKSFSVVVATNLPDSITSQLSDFLFNARIPFISARVYGLLGTIRVSIKEHTITDNHDENPKPDLRLDRPFPALAAMAEETPDLRDLSSEDLRHTPYIILYMKALEQFRNVLGSSIAFPKTHSERRDFTGVLLSLRCPSDEGSIDSENFTEAKAAVHRSVLPTTVPIYVQAILSDENCAVDSIAVEPFWLICSGLRRFVERHGVLPLAGSLPDMTSDTQRYTRLAKIFHDKAMEDAAEVLQYTKEIAEKRGAENVISEEECFHFCKRAANIRLQRGKPLMNEVENLQPVADQLDTSGESPCLASWLLLLRAVDTFVERFDRNPSASDVDIQELESIVKPMVSFLRPDAELQQSYIEEMCRYSGSEPHVIASLIGGITAQEVIKLATKQYVPIDSVFVYDGHSQTSNTFKL